MFSRTTDFIHVILEMSYQKKLFIYEQKKNLASFPKSRNMLRT